MNTSLKVGEKYGSLTIKKIAREPIGKLGRKVYYTYCICDCGKNTRVVGNSLRSGHTKSCGCLWKKSITKHNHCFSPEYYAWNALKSRCYNKKNPRYGDYGGRGIKCDWDNFGEFLKDMGEKPKGMSLDRIDNNGNYCKKNCKWSTPKEQANNMRRNVRITYGGKTKSIYEWADIVGIKPHTLYCRLKRNWNVWDVMEREIKKGGT